MSRKKSIQKEEVEEKVLLLLLAITYNDETNLLNYII